MATYLDITLKGQSWYDPDRCGGLVGLKAGMSRRLGSSRRVLGGVRYALENGDDSVAQIYTQVDFLFNLGK